MLFQRYFADTDGDEKSNIDRDRQEARIIVGATGGSCSSKIHVLKLDDAILQADDRDLLFVEEGNLKFVTKVIPLKVYKFI